MNAVLNSQLATGDWLPWALVLVAVLVGLLVTLVAVWLLAVLVRRLFQEQREMRQSWDHATSLLLSARDQEHARLGELLEIQAEMIRGLGKVLDLLAQDRDQARKDRDTATQEHERMYNGVVLRYNQLREKARSEISQLQQVVRSRQETEVELRQQIQATARVTEEWRQCRDYHEEHAVRLRERGSELAALVVEEQLQIQGLQQHVAGDRALIEQLRGQITALEREQNTMQGDLNRIRRERDELTNDAATQKQINATRMTQLMDEKSAVEAELGRLQVAASTRETEYVTLQQAHEQAGKALAALQQAQQGARTELERRNEENTNLRRHIQELQDELAILEPPVVVPVWARSGKVQLGLDFGTHSTKIIAQVRRDELARVLCVDEPTAEYPSFALPSLVLLRDGRLYFGREALRMKEGELFRSLKVDLLPPFGKPGRPEVSYPQGTTPDLLVALYLAWVLRQVKCTIWGRKTPVQPLLNVGAPMDHLQDERLKDRYLTIVQAAWEANFGNLPIAIRQGVALAAVRDAFLSLLDRPVLSLADRQFQVLPETLAPLVSLFQDPKTPPGVYMMVDMGAGTTEMSISLLNEHEGKTIACYVDRSVFLGGDDFAEVDTLPNATAQNTNRAELVKNLRKALGAVWLEGYDKVKDARCEKNQWKGLRVLFSGGALRCPRLDREVRLKIQELAEFIFAPPFPIEWHHPAKLDPSIADGISECYLAVAHGLSRERNQWPEIAYPNDVTKTEREPGDALMERPYHEADVG